MKKYYMFLVVFVALGFFSLAWAEPDSNCDDGCEYALEKADQTVIVEKVTASPLGHHAMSWRFADEIISGLLHRGFAMINKSGFTPTIFIKPFYISKHIALVDVVTGDRWEQWENHKLTEKNFGCLKEKIVNMIGGVGKQEITGYYDILWAEYRLYLCEVRSFNKSHDGEKFEMSNTLEAEQIREMQKDLALAAEAIPDPEGKLAGVKIFSDKFWKMLGLECQVLLLRQDRED